MWSIVDSLGVEWFWWEKVRWCEPGGEICQPVAPFLPTTGIPSSSYTLTRITPSHYRYSLLLPATGLALVKLGRNFYFRASHNSGCAFLQRSSTHHFFRYHPPPLCFSPGHSSCRITVATLTLLSTWALGSVHIEQNHFFRILNYDSGYRELGVKINCMKLDRKWKKTPPISFIYLNLFPKDDF